MIILGVQGCGKSLCARAIAGEWKLPLVKFDTAAVYDKYIGETEKRIQKVFKVAEGLAPCVLWIDELEKVFAGSGPDSASADAGVSSRLLAAFFSWMQDRKAPVFVAATCNNVSVLPPELIRKGRFDELFFVDLPNQAERKQIFGIQLTSASGIRLNSISIGSRPLPAAIREPRLNRSFKLPCTRRTRRNSNSRISTCWRPSRRPYPYRPRGLKKLGLCGSGPEKGGPCIDSRRKGRGRLRTARDVSLLCTLGRQPAGTTTSQASISAVYRSEGGKQEAASSSVS